ncbi:Panacea domain-containing protein [Vaginisenegalia massiliensis]|uniref:Panacea domain-containing protein n=1 Tax=Vaginisenegalia massiliensis TaxID=2058294 RepID=UPI000F54C2CA|nr:type II toxin-antitoxin system antitoxin SocA domain-containing protein [Vaginisenegalia massiliensis]
MSQRVHSIANYLINSYERITESSFNNDEITLQKLMYFSQKTAFAFQGKPIIDEDFEGWKHGPVLPSLRFFFEYYNPNDSIHDELTETEKYIIDNTIYMYGRFAPWTLRNMSHEEKAWKNSRIGLSEGACGSRVIELDDIKKDAEEVRLYDHQFDMYLDEFEDVEGEFVSVQ